MSKILFRRRAGTIAFVLMTAIIAAATLFAAVRDTVTHGAEAAPPAASPPANDNVANAPFVYVDAASPRQVYATDTTGATLEPGEARPCGNIGATVWYYLAPYQAVAVTVDTAASNFDTVLAVWELAADVVPSPPGGGSLVGCDDNGAGTQSRLSFLAEAGHLYWLQAGGANGAGGALELGVACDPACPPTNDSFNNYAGGDLPINQETTTLGATDEPGEQRPCAGIGKTLWYAVFVSGNVDVSVDTAGSDFDTAIAVYTIDYTIPPAGLGLLPSLRSVACDDNGSGSLQSPLTFSAAAGTGYYVQAGGHDGAAGRLRIHIDCVPGPCPPSNDTSGAPSYLYIPTLPFDGQLNTRGATTEPGEPANCGGISHTVWYRIHAQVPATVVIDTAGSSFATSIAVYRPDGPSPPPGDLRQEACATSSGGAAAQLRFELARFATAFIQVGGMGSASGDLRIRVDCGGVCPPFNDYVDTPSYVSAIPAFDIAQDTRSATLEPGEQRPCGNIGKTVWYALPPGQSFHFSTEGSDFATVIAVHAYLSVSPDGGLTPVACSTTGALDFTPDPGIGYMLQVGGVDGAGGDLRLHVLCEGDCPTAIGGQGGGGDIFFQSGMTISGPDTGSGGYLPESH